MTRRGRPYLPITAAQEAARLQELVGPAHNVYRQVLSDESQPMSLRIAVAEAVLDRVLGKPVQRTETDSTVSIVHRLSSEQVQALLALLQVPVGAPLAPSVLEGTAHVLADSEQIRNDERAQSAH